MKKGLIIVNRYCELPQMKMQASRIKDEFTKLGVEVDLVKNGYNFYSSTDGEIFINSQNYSFCVFLDKDKYTARAYEKSGLRLFNSPKAIEVCDDKMLTYLQLSKRGVKLPKTIPSPLCYSNVEILNDEADIISSVLGFPVVVKLSYSSMGKGVFLAKDKNQLLNLLNTYKKDAKVFQEYVSSSKGKDVRVIVIGKKYFCAYERRSLTDDFRSNVALGGNGYAIKIPEEFIQTAEKVAEILNLDYMGIDLMYGEKGEPILCEVNSNAFFEMAEEITGKNVAKAYCEYILNCVNNNEV